MKYPKHKIPEHATCVFSGIIFSVYQWDQKMFDGSIQTFEAIYRSHSVSLLPITQEKKFIIIRESQPNQEEKIGFVSGRGDQSETSEMTAKRELREETGYVCESMFLLEHTHLCQTSKIDWNTYFYLATGCKKKYQQNLDIGGEKIEVILCSLEELFEYAHKPIADPFFTQKVQEIQQKHENIKNIWKHL